MTLGNFLTLLIEGLTIAIDRNFDKVIIYLDCQEAVQAIQKSTTKVLNTTLVRRINLQLVKMEHWSI